MVCRFFAFQHCDINIVQQTSCEPLFPVVQMQLKTYFFVPFVRPCMHLNYGVISGSHAGRDCGWHIILVAELYTTCPGERVLVATKFNVTFLPLRHCYVNTSTYFLKDAENLTTYGYVLWCGQIVCTRHYSLNTIIAFTLWLSDRPLQCPFDRWRAKPQRFRILPRLDQVSN